MTSWHSISSYSAQYDAMKVLQIGSDRSTRGILYESSPASLRQAAYAAHFESFTIIGFSRASDRRVQYDLSPTAHVIPTNSSSPLLYGLDAIRIARHVRKPDVVSAQDPFETGLAAWVIARMYRVPLHIQVHTDFLSPGYVHHSFVNNIRMIIAGFVIKRAARIRVVSEHVKQTLEEQYHLKTPITVLSIFVDIGKFQDAQPDPATVERFAHFQKKLLVVSRLEPEKHVALAITSFAEAAPADACLIIVADGSEQKNMDALIESLNIADRVFFVTDRPPLEIYPLASLVLVTSRYEGYGLVIMEALAAGKPVISTDVGIARESGAIISNEKDFPNDLKEWFANGPREMHLKDYPYKDFEDYVQRYCDDIAAAVKKV